MVQNFHMPPMGYGPGSQPEPDSGLEYMPMPQDMRTFAAHMPEIDDSAALSPALGLLREVAAAAAAVARGGAPVSFDLSGFDGANRRLIAETMGEGEVAMKIRGVPALRVQESVFAGVWVLTGAGVDRVEVAKVPSDAITRAFAGTTPAREVEPGPGVVNALPLMFELQDKSANPPNRPHVINLTLLPHTEEDLLWLDQRLGAGSVDILSRGYGNCRIRATALPHVWRVQYYNSMDTLILDTFEVTGMPEVALAAPEDLADSAARILDVLEAIQ